MVGIVSETYSCYVESNKFEQVVVHLVDTDGKQYDIPATRITEYDTHWIAWWLPPRHLRADERDEDAYMPIVRWKPGVKFKPMTFPLEVFKE